MFTERRFRNKAAYTQAKGWEADLVLSRQEGPLTPNYNDTGDGKSKLAPTVALKRSGDCMISFGQ